jgi:hypothetical protein
MSRLLFIVVASALSSTPVSAASVMNESQARIEAAKILKGDPYGKNFEQINRNIDEAQLISGGSICGARVKKPLWRFQIVVPKDRNPSGDNEISGSFVIDGRTGKLVCAYLPFLD